MLGSTGRPSQTRATVLIKPPSTPTNYYYKTVVTGNTKNEVSTSSRWTTYRMSEKTLTMNGYILLKQSLACVTILVKMEPGG